MVESQKDRPSRHPKLRLVFPTKKTKNGRRQLNHSDLLRTWLNVRSMLSCSPAYLLIRVSEKMALAKISNPCSLTPIVCIQLEGFYDNCRHGCDNTMSYEGTQISFLLE